MKNKPTKKVSLNVKNVNEAINFHKGLKVPFIISVANFTMLLESDLMNVQFLKNPRGIRFFIAYNKIRGDLNGMPVYVNDNLIKYYNIGGIYDKFYADKIFQVDIKSCYASILYNDGLIKKETFDYINKLPKNIRLASVGMMASKKSIFKFDDNGEIADHFIERSLYSDYFFYCVQKTYKIMSRAKIILGEDYLFSWVDAIYFKDESNKDTVIDFFLTEYNLVSTFSEFIEFEVELIKDFFRLRYIKNGIKTHMNIPCIDSDEKKAILKYLMNTKLSSR